ncbi:MAG: PIN domain-containing protein [bacterium]|nr:PIN domain-containing protein [bacterium]
MKILVDTSIWSLAFRRKKGTRSKLETQILQELVELINETRAVIIGPIRQEILSGISNMSQFNLLKQKLNTFDDFPIVFSDYELAAEFYNDCRKNGIQGSHIDFLICAIAANNDMPIFTSDKDFTNYSKYLDIRLHSPRHSK